MNFSFANPQASTAAPTFGTSAAPAFGNVSAVPTFGTTSTAPTFGASPAVPTFGATTTAPTFGSTPAVTTTATGLTLPAFTVPAQPAALTTTNQPGQMNFSFPTTNAATTAPTFGTTPAVTTTSTDSSITAFKIPAQPNQTTTTLAAQPSSKMTFSQLQENINKWLDELTILESDFHEQAQNINAWDAILVTNATKLTQVNEKMEQLKADHTRINNQIDFIESQQNELEELIKPLEEEKSKLLDTGVASEKEKFYQLMETVNNDLQGVAADIQTVIGEFNAANSIKDANDPLASIGKILNTHMTLLKHIDDQINSIDLGSST
ncbi:nuclear pore glycoprotein p62-like [Brevipalpus obovatus]|uniref:nuclear pore glycoprotein p62-like n=1 Tax=Brevipalpus obovatus TaxID=246614 RepID=UPI003D9E0E6E